MINISRDQNDENRYDDILDRKRPEREERLRMPMSERAAQFSPFAALTGFEGMVDETARIRNE